MTLEEAYQEARSDMSLVEQFNRLNGSGLRKLGTSGGIDGAIDDATGRTEADEEAFLHFFLEYIWAPVTWGALREVVSEQTDDES